MNFQEYLAFLPFFFTLLVFFIFKNNLLSLLLGFLSALLIAAQGTGHGVSKLFFSSLNEVLANKNILASVTLCVLIGLFISLLTKSCALDAFTKFLCRRSLTPTKLYLMGIAIFFDDRISAVTTGNVYKNYQGAKEFSPQKASMLVDSSAAPISSLAFVSTWVALLVSLVHCSFEINNAPYDAYLFFIESIPFNFYPIFLLLIIATSIFTHRDFAFMAKSERRFSPVFPSPTFKNPPVNKNQLTLFLAVLGLLLFLAFSLIFYLKLGHLSEPLFKVHKEQETYMLMLLAIGLSLFLGVFLTLFNNILSPHEMFSSFSEALKPLMTMILTLVLAWCYAKSLYLAGTLEFFSSIILANCKDFLLPAMALVSASLVSLLSGSSLGTMSILAPILLSAALKLNDSTILMASFASLLSGSVFGDHLSQISDTTILSSHAAGSPLESHVKAQAPYGMLAFLLSIICSLFSCHEHFQFILALGFGFLASFLLLFIYGQKSPLPNTSYSLSEDD